MSVHKYPLSMIVNIAGIEQEVELEVSYIYLPAEYGAREKGGLQLEPDYPKDIEILSVRARDVNINWMFTDDTLRRIADEILGE